MGKKGKGNKCNLNRESHEPSSVTPSSSSLLLSRQGKNKVAPEESIRDPEIPFADMLLHPDDKKDLCIKVEGEPAMTNEESLLEKVCEYEDDGQMNEQLESWSEKASKRRKKKERQREKKLARKMAAKRRDSELSLGEFIDEDQEEVPAKDSKTVKIALWRHPFTTLEYFLREIPCLLCDVRTRYVANRRRRSEEVAFIREILVIVFTTAIALALTYLWIAAKGPLALQIKQYISWYFYWIFLGILSSVGLGTGLHTFILYLGPFIAKVSLAAQECYTLDFPQPPYPNQVICPSDNQEGHHETPSVWAISTKVRWETLAWGFGTALGELPPYFVARAASLADQGSDSEDDLENQNGFLAKVQLMMRDFVMKVGFWGILICASIPNPLFDLAGITCGHFQVPFLIFFGATAIGKTIVKSQLQMIFVILAFNDNSLEKARKSVGRIPKIGTSLRKAITDFMDYQRAALHNKDTAQSGGVLKLLTEIIVIVMLVYFVGSIINGMARSYHKRINLENLKREKKASKLRKKPKSIT